MIGRATEITVLAVTAALALAGSGLVREGQAVPTARPGVATSPTVAFLKARAVEDPLDYVAHNRLASSYVKLLRDSGEFAYLELAAVEARASLAAVPAERNPGGLSALALVDFESHDFAGALSSAERAYRIDPNNTGALALCGDAELELGNYENAARIYDQLGTDAASAPVLARRARLAELHGHTEDAGRLLAQAGDQDGWYHVRRGELLFRAGDLDGAEREYSKAPQSFAQLDHLAELRAAQGRYDEAVAAYSGLFERSGRAETLQALGDLYSFRGQPEQAKPWYDRARAAYLDSVAAGNNHYLHHLAEFYCDSEEDPAEALRWARKDLQVRHSIYAWDALAWALYKSGDFAGARDASAKATALGTRDAHLLYHAAMISLRTGDAEKGRSLLQQVLVVNPAYNRFHVHR
ncbi:MAG TPA: tetratricopeptide repeat protein [Candidatus Limnocylindrales bacterium]|nr:tetratricopeptide repeat protein [Candidatus Limnocylindrales bacterium]